MIEKSAEIDQFRNKVQGHSFDLDYSHDAIFKMALADTSLDSISRLLTDSLYVARQLNIRTKISQASPDQASSSPSASKSLLSRVRKQNKTTIGLDKNASSSASSPKDERKNKSATSSEQSQLLQPPQRSQTMVITTGEPIAESTTNNGTADSQPANSFNSVISEES